eukprot:CAMPEP_0115640704 /NCGR_PEP_ID=MMETSP0272-20121206/35929_1 /TAXON_ID=71861 /ORGANISM="Scrippsiella trochoidea, Strain CCMP3099" /LENGTH=46 /DNA_ID= /DNA_START= /DNA_END= /DNA_ORIENTATION=
MTQVVVIGNVKESGAPAQVEMGSGVMVYQKTRSAAVAAAASPTSIG